MERGWRFAVAKVTSQTLWVISQFFTNIFIIYPHSIHHDIKIDIIYDSFGVRAAKVDGILHLTGGWSNSGDSDMVPIMMMMMIIKIIVLIEIMNIIVLMMIMKIIVLMMVVAKLW